LKRYIFLGVIGLALVIAALVLNELFVREEPAPPATQSADMAPAPPSGAPTATPAPTAPTSLQAPATAPKPVAPSFDIVRVNPKGDVVMAGRAEPNATVTILDGDKPVGTVQADGRGEWVWVPSEPLAPGSRSLTLLAQSPGGAALRSESAIVLVVPERDRDIAGQPSAEPAKPLALMVPREGTGATIVLQAPTTGGQVSSPAPPAGAQQSGARPRPAGMALTVDALDYDERGRVSFSGRAEAAGRLLAYIDNKVAGQTTANGRGDWKLTPDLELAIGQHQLRVDLIAEPGKVLARVELIFHRAPMMADVGKPGSVVIQPGNNLWRIARQTYGAGIQYTLIFDANRNQIRDPNLIYPGQVFALPPVN
jgi:nucleoid-associated protein YgaU